MTYDRERQLYASYNQQVQLGEAAPETKARGYESFSNISPRDSQSDEANPSSWSQARAKGKEVKSFNCDKGDSCKGRVSHCILVKTVLGQRMPVYACSRHFRRVLYHCHLNGGDPKVDESFDPENPRRKEYLE